VTTDADDTDWSSGTPPPAASYCFLNLAAIFISMKFFGYIFASAFLTTGVSSSSGQKNVS